MIVKVFGYLILISIDFKVHLTPNFLGGRRRNFETQTNKICQFSQFLIFVRA